MNAEPVPARARLAAMPQPTRRFAPVSLGGRAGRATSATRAVAAAVGIALLALVALSAAACTSGSAPSGSPVVGEPTATTPVVSAPGGEGSGTASGPSGGAGSGGPPTPPQWSSGPGQPGAGSGPSPQPSFVTPIAGLHAIHDVKAVALTASVGAGRISATVSWWSGPAPCSALSEVQVARVGNAFTLTVREGAQQLGVACPALAMNKATTVDLGAVAPGSYTVAATGVDTPVAVVVP